MRDEWNGVVSPIQASSYGGAAGRSSQGLTQARRGEMMSLTMAGRAMKLKGLRGGTSTREISPRRQVGDVESVVNAPVSGDGRTPWWKNVGMEEGL